MFTYREMSAPFEYKGSTNKAALLLHGFLASPYIMRSMGKFLNSQGYHVKCITLPGHGTEFNDLRSASFENWKQAVDDAVSELKSKHEEVIIVGFSIGAILGLIAAFEHHIDRLILICPAFKITKAAEFFRVLSEIRLSFLLPDLFCTQSEKVNFGSYTQFPAYGVIQVQKAINYYHKQLRLQKPLPQIYVAASTEDGTVHFEGVLEAMVDYQQEGSHFRIYTNNPAKLEHYVRQGGNKEIIDTCQFNNVIAFSHVALPVSPDDPYFGKNGAYYGKQPDNIKWGEPTWRDKGKSIKRLTYNPDFEAMTQDMLGWLSTN